MTQKSYQQVVERVREYCGACERIDGRICGVRKLTRHSSDHMVVDTPTKAGNAPDEEKWEFSNIRQFEEALKGVDNKFFSRVPLSSQPFQVLTDAPWTHKLINRDRAEASLHLYHRDDIDGVLTLEISIEGEGPKERVMLLEKGAKKSLLSRILPFWR